MKKLVLALSAACLALVAVAVTPEILSDAGGAESAGPVPSALILTTRPGEKATTPGENASIDTGVSVTEPGVPEVDYTIDLNTGAMTPLPETIIRSLGRTAEGKWGESLYAASPHGSLLAYVGTGDEGSLQIFIAGIDGTGVRQVTHHPTGATSPAWSPDGTMIAYTVRGGLFVLDVAMGESTQIAGEATVMPWTQPQFTPDGSSLLYGSGGGTGVSGERPGELRTVPVSGGKSTLLIGRAVGPGDGLADAGNGSLSPDGSLVTFLGSGFQGTQHCGPCRWVANADGTERRIIPGWISNPAGTWSPDGNRIVSLDYGGNIIVVDIATGAASPVAKGNGAIWLDRHALLVEAGGPPP